MAVTSGLSNSQSMTNAARRIPETLKVGKVKAAGRTLSQLKNEFENQNFVIFEDLLNKFGRSDGDGIK